MLFGCGCNCGCNRGCEKQNDCFRPEEHVSCERFVKKTVVRSTWEREGNVDCGCGKKEEKPSCGCGC